MTLNISRETLQQNSQLRAIGNKIEKKIKSELADMRDNDREAYEKFFTNFGRVIKFGIYSSYGMKAEQLADLLLFYSAKQEKFISFDDYIESGQPDQDSIYYAAGESVEILSSSPIVKSVLEKGYDVLLCTQDVDEFCLTSIPEYKEKSLKNVAGGDLGLESEEEKEAAEEIARENKDLFTAMKDVLNDQVTKVAVSTRLTDAPACITAAGPISLEMEKVLSQTRDDNDVRSERVLEVNADHPIFSSLKEAQATGDEEKIKLYTEILYNQSLLIEGLPIDDPAAFTQAVNKLMV